MDWGWLRGRLTPARILILCALAVTPLVAAIVLVVGIRTGSVAPAMIVAGALLAAVAAVAIPLAVVVLGRLKRVRAALDGESIRHGRAARRRLEVVTAVSPVVANSRRALRPRRVPVDVIAGFGMATKSPFARELLAERATEGRISYSEVARAAAGRDLTIIERDLGRLEPLAAILLARTVASQATMPDDSDVAAGLALAVARHDAPRLSLSARQTLLERLVLAGRRDEAARLLRRGKLPLSELLVRADTENPFLGDDRGELDQWLGLVNSLYLAAGLEPLSVTGSAAHPFDRLSAESTDSVGGELVSVVMTTYRPERAALLTAVESIRAQSWREWELIIVDDGSPREHHGLLDEVEALDPRIVMVREGLNAGTYARRNIGLDRARGEYVTFQDADDWSHPRRIELQVRALEHNPRGGAVLSRSLRATERLAFVQPRGVQLRITESSLLFRRRPVVERLGGFDPVRKAADTGFRLRLEAVTGHPVPVVAVGAPLSLVRFDTRSLSGNELGDGWMHPARVAYSSAQTVWLESLRGSPTPDVSLGEHRKFPAPAAISGVPRPDLDLDVLFVCDVRRDDPRSQVSVLFDAEIAHAAARGLRVGIRRADALVARTVGAVARRPLQVAINSGQAVEVLPGDVVRSRLVVGLDEAALVGIGSRETPISAQRLVVVASPVSSGAARAYWTRAAALDGIARLVPESIAEVLVLDDVRSIVEDLSRP